MTIVSRSALVPHTAQEIFSLVDAIEDYPEFLPWCRSSTVHRRSADMVEATLEIRKAGIDQIFTTRNSISPGQSIELELLEGPFDYFNGKWRFQDLGQNIGNSGAKVLFDLNYQFSNPLMQVLLSPSFQGIVDSLVDAFVLRAVEVYGPRSHS